MLTNKPPLLDHDFFDIYANTWAFSGRLRPLSLAEAQHRYSVNPSSEGVYAVEAPGNPPPLENGNSTEGCYTVIHWPQATQAALASPRGVKARQRAGIKGSRYPSLASDYPDAFDLQWRTMKLWFESHLLAGMRTPTDTAAPFIQQLRELPHVVGESFKYRNSPEITYDYTSTYRYFKPISMDTTILPPGIIHLMHVSSLHTSCNLSLATKAEPYTCPTCGTCPSGDSLAPPLPSTSKQRPLPAPLAQLRNRLDTSRTTLQLTLQA